MKLKPSAFTLIEVVIACAIFILILESVYVTLQVGQKSWNYYSDAVSVKQEVRRCLLAISSELREAKNIFIVRDLDDSGVTLRFERPGIGEISYQWRSSGENAGEVIRRNYNETRVLGKNVKFLSFDYPMDNAITIELAAGKEKEFYLKQKVALRQKTSFFVH